MGNSVEQLPNESSKAFEAARLYCELGPARSLRQVADRLGKSSSLINRWSAQFEWVVRAEQYDRAQLVVVDAARDEVLAGAAAADAALWVRRGRELRELEWGLYQELVAVAREHLKRAAASSAVTVAELIELMAFAGELGRAALGVESGEEEQGDGQGETSRGSGITVQVAYINSVGAAGAP